MQLLSLSASSQQSLRTSGRWRQLQIQATGRNFNQGRKETKHQKQPWCNLSLEGRFPGCITFRLPTYAQLIEIFLSGQHDSLIFDISANAQYTENLIFITLLETCIFYRLFLSLERSNKIIYQWSVIPQSLKKDADIFMAGTEQSNNFSPPN